jgi:hypothetical protein
LPAPDAASAAFSASATRPAATGIPLADTFRKQKRSEAVMFVSAASSLGFRQNPVTRSGQNLPSGAAAGQTSPETSESRSGVSASDPVSAFRDLIKGTPEQRMFRMFLARHKLSEEQYAALPAEDKKKLKDEFEKETKGSTAASHAPVDITV